MFNNLFKPIDTLHKGLSASWTRNTIIRNNIANVETPNFKASGLEFESVLRRAFLDSGKFRATVTHPKHIYFGPLNIDDVRPVVFQRNELSMRADGNNVDIEAENIRLAQNSIFYNTLVEKMNGEIRRLKMASSEGR